MQPLLTVADAAALPGARLVFGDPAQVLSGVTTDTREDGLHGKLYIALRGETKDGHEFLSTAADRGVRCVLIEHHGVRLARDLSSSRKLSAAVSIPNTLLALGELARRHRAKLSAKIIAITGSNGKTSTKDFAHAILSTTYETVSAPRSFNNAIGVPLTILKMNERTQVGVLEIGMNHPGEIASLTRIANPDLAAITSVASAHAGFFRSLRQVALAKSEILTASRPGIPVFLPADSPFLPLLARSAAGKKVWTFGTSKKASLKLTSIRASLKNIIFSVQMGLEGRNRKNSPVVFRCPNFGEHQLTNILLAIGIAGLLCVPYKKIRSVVAKLCLPPGRGNLIRIGPHVLIDDSYNANPASMAASFRRVHEFQRIEGRAGSRRRLVLVLGDMLELGPKTKSDHRNIGVLARTLNPWRILFVGEQGVGVRTGFISAGGPGRNVITIGKTADAIPILKEWMREQEKLLILAKASHQICIERIVSGISQ